MQRHCRDVVAFGWSYYDDFCNLSFSSCRGCWVKSTTGTALPCPALMVGTVGTAGVNSEEGGDDQMSCFIILGFRATMVGTGLRCCGGANPAKQSRLVGVTLDPMKVEVAVADQQCCGNSRACHHVTKVGNTPKRLTTFVGEWSVGL